MEIELFSYCQQIKLGHGDFCLASAFTFKESSTLSTCLPPSGADLVQGLEGACGAIHASGRLWLHVSCMHFTTTGSGCVERSVLLNCFAEPVGEGGWVYVVTHPTDLLLCRVLGERAAIIPLESCKKLGEL